MALSEDEKAFFVQLGTRVAELRKAEGITQVQMAELLGVSQQTINSYEVGRRRIPVSSLPVLARTLGVSMEELICSVRYVRMPARSPLPGGWGSDRARSSVCSRFGEPHGEDRGYHHSPTLQMARNLTDVEEPFLRHTRFLIMDRDAKYSATFRAALTRERVEPIRLPPRSPNLNAFAERFVRSIRSECLNRMIFLGQDSLQHAISQFMAHYHAERTHQGLENRLVQPCPIIAPSQPVHRRQRLGGMLN